MKALILAAGYGVRLYPLTKRCPKPLLPVAKKPIIEHIIAELRHLEGLDEIIVVTNTKFYPFFKCWLDNFNCKIKITLVDDLTKHNSERRGAIGDIKFVVDRLKNKSDLLVIGGDNVFDFDLEPFVSFASSGKKKIVIGVYDVESKLKATHFGVVTLGKGNRLVNFVEKPKSPKSSLIAMCLYYFPKETLDLINRYLKQRNSPSDATGFYIDWLRKRPDGVYGHRFSGNWYDIGGIDFYRDANKQFFKKEKK